MSERFTKIYSIDNTLYADGSPIAIRAAALLKDTTTGKMIAQLKLQSVAEKPINYVKVSVTPIDSVNNPLGNAITYEYLDLTVAPYVIFGNKKAIFLPNPSTRSFFLHVLSVGFVDGTVWNSDGTAFTVVAPDSPISLLIGAEDTYKVALPLLNSQSIDEVAKAKEMLESILPLKDVTLEIAQCDQNIATLQARAEEAKKKARKTKIIVVIVASVFLLFILALVIYNYVTSEVLPQKAKDAADQLQADQQYVEAYDAYIDCYNGSYSKVESDYILDQVGYALGDMLRANEVEAAFRYLHHVGNNYIWGMDDFLGGDYPLSFWNGDEFDPTKFSEGLLSVLQNPEFFRLDYPEHCASLIDYEINLLKSCLTLLENAEYEVSLELWETIVTFCLQYNEIYTISYSSTPISRWDLENYVDSMINGYLMKGNLSGLFQLGNANPELMKKLLGYAEKSEENWQFIDQARLWDGINAILNSNEDFIVPSSGGDLCQWKLDLMWQAFRHIDRSFNDGDSLLLKELFNKSASISSLKEEINDDRSYLSELWHYSVMKDIFLNGENLIWFLLDGVWVGETDSDAYLEFELKRTSYGKYSMTMNWDGLSIPETSGDFSFDIEDRTLSFYDSYSRDFLCCVFKFYFSSYLPTQLNLYCYEDGETVAMIRE